ncbi:hypothetical protein ACF3MZ_01955 [Paenibacillaceae bacterium WGS1546]|uniref:hypothetical protein n=1 Tax=Cohnella sp. WGS1546 TaxID=3366810 RepID=UPI00372D1C90
MLKQRRKMFSIFILVCMIGTAAMPVAASVAREAGERAGEILGFKPIRDKVMVPNERISPVEPVVLQTEVTGVGDDEQVIYQGSRDSLEAQPQDWFSFTTEQMERYLQDGFTISDLYEADARANQLFIAPEELLEIKKTEDDWEKVEKIAIKENAQRIVEQVYRAKYPNEYKEMRKHKLDPEIQLQLFAYYHRDNSSSIKDLINSYQKSPETFNRDQIKLMEKSASWVTKAPNAASSQDQQRATASSDISLSARDQQLMRDLAEKSGRSVEALTEQYRSFIKGAR